MTKILGGNGEKSFLEWEKMVSRKVFRHFLHANFQFMFILLISNHTVLLVQFGINLHLWVFQKAEIALVEAARAISAFWKTHSCKLIPNWTSKTVWLPMLIIIIIIIIITIIIIIMTYMKKLLSSDWLRAVQFQCNTSANYTS